MKPTHIGSFILAYARKIMNNYIRIIGPENIFYSDTDSLFVTAEAAKRIKLSTDIGGMKNEYGKGILVTYALFLDIKRYYIKFNKPTSDGKTFKCAFNGINFKQENCMENWKDGDDTDEDAVLKMMIWLRDNPGKTSDITVVQDRWNKGKDSVEINTNALKFQVNPSARARWPKNSNFSFPLNYNEKDKMHHLGPVTKFRTGIRRHYTISQHGLRCSLPLQSKFLTNNSPMVVCPDVEIKTPFVLAADGKYYHKNNRNKLFEINNFGITSMLKKSKILRNVLVIPYQPGRNYPSLTEAETRKLEGEGSELYLRLKDDTAEKKKKKKKIKIKTV